MIPGLSAACLSSPRSPIEPTTLLGSVCETTGSCDTRCSCSSAIACLTFCWVSTTTSGGISPAACFARSTSPTLRSLVRSSMPCDAIQVSLKIFER